MRLLLATSNPGKLKEMRRLLATLPVSLISLSDLPHFRRAPVAPETGRSFTAIARRKSQSYGHRSQLWTVADDSGLVIDALHSKPGIYSRRYGATDTQRIARVLNELKGVPWSRRTARFICVLALYQPQESTISTFRASVPGFITTKPTGQKNFGYDPIFFCPALGKTFAQADLKEKNRVSHRAQAVMKLRAFLDHQLRTTPV